MSTSTTRPATVQDQEAASLYDSDIHAWSVEQASALRRRDFAAVDWDNVAEEIESMSRTEEHKWTSKCANAITHMLKIEHCQEASQAELEGWEEEIQRFRRDMSDTIVDSPSLQSKYAAMFAKAWQRGRREACYALAEYDVQNKQQSDRRLARKRRSLMLPRECPYRFEDVTAFDLKKREKNLQHDDAVLPPQVARVLDQRRSRDRGPGRSR